VSTLDSATRGSVPRPTQPMPFPETISVIVTAWRRRQFLEEALSSVRVGVGSPVELVVVSDFHDGDLEREVQGRHGKWVVSQEERWGAMIADGIRAARGSIIALLDDDDLFHPLRLAEVRRAFDENPDLGFFHNAHVAFRDGESPVFPETLSPRDWLRIPPGRRTRSDCARIWTEGAGYNGSSTVVRRSLLEPSLDEIRDIRKGVPPYLFYRAWCSSAAIVVDSRPLTAVRLHSENTTPTRFQGRRARFARLALIAPDLSADAETILAVVGPGVWDMPLRQMSSMGVILSASRDSAEGSRRVAGAALELLRRRRIWLPRWILVTLALVRIGSRHGAQAFFNWLTIPR